MQLVLWTYPLTIVLGCLSLGYIIAHLQHRRRQRRHLNAAFLSCLAHWQAARRTTHKEMFALFSESEAELEAIMERLKPDTAAVQPSDVTPLAENNLLPEDPPATNQTVPHHPNTPLECHPAFARQIRPCCLCELHHGNTSGRNAIGRTLRVLSHPEVQQAIAPFWQKNDMRRQLHLLERLHSALQGSVQASAALAQPPAHPAPAGSPAPNPHTSVETISPPHSTPIS